MKNAAARNLLAKHFPASTANSDAKRPAAGSSNRKAVAQSKRVEQMRMRLKAEPGDPKESKSGTSVDQRIHVVVSLDQEPRVEKIYWFRKTIGTGKVLDLLASQLGVVAAGPSLQLIKTDSQGKDRIVLRTDLPLSDQVEDGSYLFISQ